MKIIILISLFAFEAQAGGPRWVGIFRGDGVVVPAFLRVDDVKWITPWPMTDNGTFSPKDKTDKSLDKVPAEWTGGKVPPTGSISASLADWTVWERGKPKKPAQAGALVYRAAHCEAVWGLETRKGPSDQHTSVEAAGLATTALEVDSGQAVGPSDSAWVFMDKLAREKGAGKPVKDSPLKEVVAFRRGKNTNYFFTAEVLSQEKSPEANCPRSRVISGWVYRKAGGKPVVTEVQVTGTDCDHKEVRSENPLGAFVTDGKIFFVSDVHGYEDSRIVLREFKKGTFSSVAELAAGGC